MTISEQVRRVLAAEEISEAALAMMLERAAITSLHGFRRRYFHWIFQIDKDVLVAMQHADIVEVGDGETRMLEDHEACDGQGCRGCGWIRQIGRWVSDKQLSKPESLNGMLARGTVKERKLQDQAGSSRRFGRRHSR